MPQVVVLHGRQAVSEAALALAVAQEVWVALVSARPLAVASEGLAVAAEEGELLVEMQEAALARPV